MIKNKYKKILLISFCIVFVIMSIITGVLEGNVLHTRNCCKTNCSYCAMINISNNFIKNLFIIEIQVLLLLATIPLMQVIYKNKNKFQKTTLVELKVIQIK